MLAHRLSLPSVVAHHSAPVDVVLMYLSSTPYDLTLNKRIIFKISFGHDSFTKLVFEKGQIIKLNDFLGGDFPALVCVLSG